MSFICICNVRAVDVSDKGDWSRAKIWYAANHDLGTTSYAASGFIYKDRQIAVADKVHVWK
jgi:hypothetical protein